MRAREQGSLSTRAIVRGLVPVFGVLVLGACSTVEPASRWNLVLESLQVPSTNYAGVPWDAFGGAPDPVVDIWAGSGSSPVVRVNGADDTFSLTYSSSAGLRDVRADDLLTLLRFDVLDEDVTDYEPIGACFAEVDDSTFSGASRTVNCPVDAASGNSGFTLVYHLERF